MKVVIISDTHELHREVEIPPCDLLIHAGDFTFFSKSPRMIEDFNDWLGEVPARHVVITCGNHEFAVEADPDKWRKRLSNAILLLNESVEIEGIRIWGSPITPFYGGAFGMSNKDERERIFSAIPKGTDILVTHEPPFGVLDAGNGCRALRRAVIRVKPRLHAFGHNHSSYGTRLTTHTLFANAAILDESGAPSRKPIQVVLKERPRA